MRHVHRLGLTLALLASLSTSDLLAQEVTVLKAGHSAAPTEPYHLALTRMAELVDERSEGRLQIEVFPASQLGTEREMVEGLLLGTLDIAVPGAGTLGNFVPDLEVLGLPFLYRDNAHWEAVVDGEVGDMLAVEMAEQGFQPLGYYFSGARHIMTVEQPIESIADLQGLKMRVPPSNVMVEGMGAMGAVATPIAYNELYGALQSRVVDGAEAANSNYYAMKFYEVAPNWAIVSWLLGYNVKIMSQERFDSLPEDLQEILVEAAAEATRLERDLYYASETEKFDLLVEAGVNVTNPPREPFVEAATAIYPAFVTTPEQEHILQLIHDTK
jgi:tripartite ATP-independent transporter DctP family solute receptor